MVKILIYFLNFAGNRSKTRNKKNKKLNMFIYMMNVMINSSKMTLDILSVCIKYKKKMKKLIKT